MSKGTKKQLGINITDLATFIIKMANQRRVRSVRLICDMKITIQGSWFATTFTVLKMEANEGSYPMLLGRTWLKMAQVKGK